MMQEQDTIAALATPAGRGGIGILRLSGPRAWEVGARLFRPQGAPLDIATMPTRRMLYGRAVDPGSGQAVDEVLCVFFRGPHSYTTEDSVEVQGHGGPAVMQRLLEIALECGCRLARPGEFTLRAFLGGRLDLSRAEAVAELVAARSRGEAALALAGLMGGLASRLAPVRSVLLSTAATVEAAIDFPEDLEALDGPGLALGLEEGVGRPLRGILEERQRRRVFREGARVVLCGRPNVGKSSLFNALLGRGRALVSPVSGTTRDWLEEAAVLMGVTVRLVDTAGLGQGGEAVEAMGQEAARELLGQADMGLVVLDGSQPLTGEDLAVLGETEGRPRVVAINKADMPWSWELAELGPAGREGLRVSAKTGLGVEALVQALGRGLTGGEAEPGPGEAVASARQAQALGRALAAVQRAGEGLLAGAPAVELVSLDLAEALAALGEVDGQGAPEEVIEAIFSEFCLGK